MNEPLQPKDHAEAVALFRAQVIGALAQRTLEHGELAGELRSLAEKRFRPPGSDTTRKFAVSTLERWLYDYRRAGLEALRPQSRSVGHALALTPEQRDLVLEIRRENPGASAGLILQTLIADGRLPEDLLSPPTLARLYREHGLDRATLRQTGSGKVRLRWQAERPNALWHGDVCYGPSLLVDGARRPIRIHAFLDDASRFVVALEAHHSEREIDMLHLLVAAFQRHGVCDALYLDNGPTYRGQALRLACERMGVTLLHAAPYDAAARGKMERFWRRLREQCLDFCGSLTSLHDLNVRLCAYLDQQYHVTAHGGLYGKTPAEVWNAAERDRHADPLDDDVLRRALTVSERRRIRKDGTLSVEGHLFELDLGFLAGRLVTVERYLLDPADPPIVVHDGKRHQMHAVDVLANAKRPRPRPKAPEPTRPFDPPGALLDRAAGRRPRHGKEDCP